MADVTDPKRASGTESGGASLPLRLSPLPPNMPLIHDAEETRRKLEDELSVQKYYRIALGYVPDHVAHIQLFPLDRLPLPPQSDAGYPAALASYLKYQMENEEKEKRVLTATYAAWTTLCSALAIAAETNRPSLARQIRTLCDLSSDPDLHGYGDGPRAFGMVVNDLANGGERTKQDKAFYDDALALQVNNRLPDGCAAAEFRKKAEAFVEKIRPHLSRKFEQYDAMEYIVDLMPTVTLKIHRRQLITEFKAANATGNSAHVIDECYKVVQMDQKAAPQKPALAAVPDSHTYTPGQLTQLQDTCGVALALAAATGLKPPKMPGGGGTFGGGGKGTPGGDKKWCDQCGAGGGHANVRRPDAPKKPCISNPYYKGTYPPGIYCVDEKKATVDAARLANAKKESERTGKTVVAEPLTAPPASEVASWKEWRAKMEAKKSKAKETPGGVAVPNQLSNFYQSLQDVGDDDFGSSINACAVAADEHVMYPGPRDAISLRESLGPEGLHDTIERAYLARDPTAMQNLFLDGTYDGPIQDVMPNLFFKPDWVEKIMSGEKTEEARVLQWHWEGDVAAGLMGSDELVPSVSRPAADIGVGDWVIGREPDRFVIIFAVTARTVWDTIGAAFEAHGQALIPPSLAQIPDANAADAFYQTMFDGKRRQLINPDNGIPNACIVTFTVTHIATVFDHRRITPAPEALMTGDFDGWSGAAVEEVDEETEPEPGARRWYVVEQAHLGLRHLVPVAAGHENADLAAALERLPQAGSGARAIEFGDAEADAVSYANDSDIDPATPLASPPPDAPPPVPVRAPPVGATPRPKVPIRDIPTSSPPYREFVPPPDDAKAVTPKPTNVSAEDIRYDDFAGHMPSDATPVDVPLGCGNAAGGLGARFDRLRRRWWLPPGHSVDIFNASLDAAGHKPAVADSGGSRLAKAVPPTAVPAIKKMTLSGKPAPPTREAHALDVPRKSHQDAPTAPKPSLPPPAPAAKVETTAVKAPTPKVEVATRGAGGATRDGRQTSVLENPALLKMVCIFTLTVVAVVAAATRDANLACVGGAGAFGVGVEVARDGTEGAARLGRIALRFTEKHLKYIVWAVMLLFIVRWARSEVLGGAAAQPLHNHTSDDVLARCPNWVIDIDTCPEWWIDMTDADAPLSMIMPSPPPSPPEGNLDETSGLTPPRADLLDEDQAGALRLELLAGHAEPKGLPDWLKVLCIGDTGCGTDMFNRTEQAKEGTWYHEPAKINGAGGALSTKWRATLQLPVPTNRGLGAYVAPRSIYNKMCAYVLLALGRQSRLQGVRMVMPAWGLDGYFEYPNGVRVQLQNRSVLVVRPIGYKESPKAALAGTTLLDAIGIPADGDFALGLAIGEERTGDIPSALAATIAMIPIDTCRGGATHDLSDTNVIAALITAASSGRCRFTFVCIPCNTYCAAHFLPDANGNPGSPHRDINNIRGIPQADGTLTPVCVKHNTIADGAAEICMATCAQGGFFIAETAACRRDGFPDATPGCEKHAYLYDQPSWVRLQKQTNASIMAYDQCRTQNSPADVYKVGRKATANMSSDDAGEVVAMEFGGLRCNHPAGTHKPLRGADERGTYRTSGTHVYSSTLCSKYASCCREVLSKQDAVQPGEVSALVAGVLHGKRVPRGSIDARFLHSITNHSEARVVKHISKAWCDVPDWCEGLTLLEPCEPCLRGDAPKIGPSGTTPTDEGLCFLDLWHTQVPAIFTGNTTRLVMKHAKTKFFTSVAIKKKSEAPEAYELKLAYFASVGRPITWNHSDCAGELKAGGMVPIARKHLIRLTTTVPGVGRTNAVEPDNRVAGKVIRTLLSESKLPCCFHEYAYDYFLEGYNLLPSREPPHDCRLGRLLGKKPSGMHRRPFGLLAYVTDAPRLPSGTLTNKTREQGIRCIHLGYSGSRCGSYEKIGTDRAKPGYIFFHPESGSEIISESARFIVGCFPGLKRTTGGGWAIPLEKIPFSAEALSQDPQPTTHEQLETHKHNHADAPQLPSGTLTNKTRVQDIRPFEAIPFADLTDDKINKADEELTDFDYESIDFRRGFAPESKANTSDADSRDATTTTAPKAKPEKPPPPRALISSADHPDEKCDEHDGRGWEVELIQYSKNKKWVKCRFINARTLTGGIWYAVWRRPEELLAVKPTGASDTHAVEASNSRSATEGADGAAPTDSAPPLAPPPPPSSVMLPRSDAAPAKEPNTAEAPAESDHARTSSRERRPPDRYINVSTLAARYCKALGSGYSRRRRPNPDDLYIDLEEQAERFAGLAGIIGTDPIETRNSFATLDPVLQRAAAVMADHALFADELGPTSDQAREAREVYAAARADAVSLGHALPPLEPLYTAVEPPDSINGKLLREAACVSAEEGAMLALAAIKATAGAEGNETVAHAPEYHHVDVSAAAPSVRLTDMFDDRYDGCTFHDVNARHTDFDNFAALAKARTSPDIYSEKQMTGPEWDEPKSVEVSTLLRMGAMTKIRADDPKISGWKVVDTMFTGRTKRDADRNITQLKGRCVLRGDLHKCHYHVDENQRFAPVVRNVSACSVDAVSCLRRQHVKSFDVGSAYLYGEQMANEQVVARPPMGPWREYAEDGCAILWLMNGPLYGQADAGAIWNRTFSHWVTKGNQVRTDTSSTHAADIVVGLADAQKPSKAAQPTPEPVTRDAGRDTPGLTFSRCPHDPCVFSRRVAEDGSVITMPIYVDDGRFHFDPTKEAMKSANEDMEAMAKRFKVKYGPLDPPEDYFLGANRFASSDRAAVTLRATTYIQSMIERYCKNGKDSREDYPSSWSHTPADDELTRAHEEASATRTPAPDKLFKEYNSLVGSLRHAVKYRPEISAAMDLLGCCLTFPTERLLKCAYHVLIYLGRTAKLGVTYSAHGESAKVLYARADANWRPTRPTTGFVIFLADGAISHCCRRQSCIAMSTTEAELVALADAAIELIYIMSLLSFIGYTWDGPVSVETDNKGAYDLCHRFTSAQHSRHIDRKMFKMRELNGAGTVKVKYVHTDQNTADIFTKVLGRQPFEKHRSVVMNLPAGKGLQEAFAAGLTRA